MLIVLTNIEIITRLIVAAVLGSAVGFEREKKGQDAGFRTHILVSLGSAIFTIIQLEAAEFVVQVISENPDAAQVLSSDVTRLISQIVSGIGFLGAGTIIVTNRSVKGLTTAASIWAIASIGMAAGVGQYFLAFVGTVIILIVLRLIQRVFQVEETKRITIKYGQREKTLTKINNYFKENNIHILRIEYNVSLEGESPPLSHDTFVIGIPREMDLNSLIEDLIEIPELISISTAKDDAKG